MKAKKLLAMILSLTMILGLCTVGAKADVSGAGTEEDPYLVSTWAELSSTIGAIPDGGTAYIKLTADLSRTSASHLYIGTTKTQHVILDGDDKTVAWSQANPSLFEIYAGSSIEVKNTKFAPSGISGNGRVVDTTGGNNISIKFNSCTFDYLYSAAYFNPGTGLYLAITDCAFNNCAGFYGNDAEAPSVTITGNEVTNTDRAFEFMGVASTIKGNAFSLNDVLVQNTGSVSLNGNYWGSEDEPTITAGAGSSGSIAAIDTYYTTKTVNSDPATGADFTLSNKEYTQAYLATLVTAENTLDASQLGVDVTKDDADVVVTFPAGNDTLAAILADVAAENVDDGAGNSTVVTLAFSADDNSAVVATDGKVPDGTVASFDLNLVKKTVTTVSGVVTGTTYEQIPYDGGYVEVKLPFDYYDNDKVYTVYYVGDTGTEAMSATYENGYFTFVTNHFSTYEVVQAPVTDAEVADYFKLALEPIDDGNDATPITEYNIVLRGYDELGADKLINRFTAADLTFELTGTAGYISYDIVELDSIVNVLKTTNNKSAAPADNRYLFSVYGSDGLVTYNDISGEYVVLGKVVFNGYGQNYTFKIDRASAVINTTTFENNRDVVTKADGQTVGTVVTASTDYLTLVDGDSSAQSTTAAVPTAYIDPLTIFPATQKLTIDVTFPNGVDDNDSAKQNMTVTVSGGDLSQDIVVKLGDEAKLDKDNASGTKNVTAAIAPGTYPYADTAAVTSAYEQDSPYTYFTTADYPLTADKYTVTLTDILTKDFTYTVTISGAGYRTVRYNVTMNAASDALGKKLTFWNNAMDSNTVIESYDGTQVPANTKVTYLAGDIVQDAQINIYDLSAVVSYFGTAKAAFGTEADYWDNFAKYDLNRDGKIDSIDVAYVLVSWGK